jgi:peptidoglycan hydrolase-like protein with peptidoglycan-binding domain
LRLSLVGRVFVGICAAVMLAAACLAQSTSATAARSAHSNQAKKKSIKRTRGLARAKKRGQQKIDNSRTQAIQEALIRENYLKGEPSGNFDVATQQALQKYQADHGWQSKVVPDSRALINLGLGPDHDHLLNPETAMTSSPAKPHAERSADQSDGQSRSETH